MYNHSSRSRTFARNVKHFKTFGMLQVDNEETTSETQNICDGEKGQGGYSPCLSNNKRTLLFYLQPFQFSKVVKNPIAQRRNSVPREISVEKFNTMKEIILKKIKIKKKDSTGVIDGRPCHLGLENDKDNFKFGHIFNQNVDTAL